MSIIGNAIQHSIASKDWSSNPIDNVKKQAPAEHKEFTMDSLLAYCSIHLREADKSIYTAMQDLEHVSGTMGELSQLQGMEPSKEYADRTAYLENDVKNMHTNLTAVKTEAAKIARGGNPSQAKANVAEAEARLTAAQQALDAHKATVDPFLGSVSKVAESVSVLASPEAAAAILNAANKAARTRDPADIKAFQDCVKAQSAAVGASRELSMVRMQSLVSQRGTMLQMITNMMSALNQSAMGIAQNMK
jgi:hypothetical protein